MKVSAIIGAILLVALIVLGFYYFRDTSGPATSLSHQRGPISAKVDVVLTLRDKGSGLKKLTVDVEQGEKKFAILSKTYNPGTDEARETFKLTPRPGFREGPFKLLVTATDRSVYNFGTGNSTELALDFSYHNKPPGVTALSTAHNVSRGGVGMVVYTVDREVEKSGVVYNGHFFPGYRQPSGFYAALFPFLHNTPEERFIPKILVIDRAGNERLTGIYYRVLPKSFPTDKIQLTDSFLEKVSSEFKHRFPDAATPLDVFLKANHELRELDAKILAESGRNTSPIPLWEGAFQRLPNSAPRGSFAQLRKYFYQGKQIDEQYHLGIDLASLAHSPIPAANKGKVVYADDLGIYGQCVIIDHGLGLQSLYGHLSRISVKVGDEVQKAQIIGNTGDTGLAGGDHLHFGIVVSGFEVNPIEWWDPSWIRNNVTSKLEEAKQSTTAP